jgi:hypothetical protein
MASIIPPMVPKLSLRRWLLLFALMAVPATYAARIVITGPGPQLHIAIGSLGTTIDTVVFDLAAVSPGSGLPIAGSAPVQVEVAYKKQGAVPINVTPTAMILGSHLHYAHCGAEHPHEPISGQRRWGRPSGSFSGAANQTLLNFTAGGAAASDRPRGRTLTPTNSTPIPRAPIRA